MKTKFLALLLAILLCLSVVAMASCGKTKIDDPEETSGDTSGTQDTSEIQDTSDTDSDEDGDDTTSETEETTTEPEPIEAVEVKLDKSSLSLIKDGTKTLTATILPENTTDKTLSWSTSDETVATVADGVVTALSVGEVTITVTTANGKTATCQITVIETVLRFKTLGIEEAGFYGKVSNATESFSFVDEVEVSENVTFEVYRDLECTELISSKTISLEVGDNTVYIREYINGEANRVYPVTVRRRPMHTVSFDTNGGTEIASQTVEEDGFVTAPADPTKVGYTFAGWSPDLALAITEATTILAQWTSNPYVVTYDANGGTVTNATTNVSFDQIYTLENPTREGYVFMGWYRGENLIAQAGTWTIPENVTLKAKWVEFSSKTLYAAISFGARASASEDAELVGIIPFAQELSTVSYENAWYKIEWDGMDDQGNPEHKVGFAHENWLTDSIQSVTLTNINKEGLVISAENMFQYPSYFAEKIVYASSGELVEVPRGEKVSVRMINGTEDWVFIYYKGYGGYFPTARLRMSDINNNNSGVTLPTIPMS